MKNKRIIGFGTLLFSVIFLMATFSCSASSKSSIPKQKGDSTSDSTKSSIPKQRGNSTIVLSEQIYGSQKTVDDLFGKPMDTTNVVITNKGNEMKISSSIMIDGAVGIKFDVTFVFSDSGTCYPSQLYYEKPSTFQSGTIYCDGGPYKDPHGFGEVFGWLQNLLPLGYNQAQ